MAAKAIKPDSKLLDIGCNCCEIFSFLKDKRITGCGIDPEPMMTKTGIPSGIDFIKAEFPSDKLTGRQFDCITALAVIEHIMPDEQKAFSQACFQLLRPGGYLVLTIPSPFVDPILHLLSFFSMIDNDMKPHQHYGFLIGETRPIFESAGFKLVKHQKFQFGLNNLFVFEKLESASM
jgi:2-polyprenyl-3-methyl-5-hydroxy-6-metoxy-1,4-benzoquinol methylase